MTWRDETGFPLERAHWREVYLNTSRGGGLDGEPSTGEIRVPYPARFETPSLDAPLELTGPVALRLRISADRAISTSSPGSSISTPTVSRSRPSDRKEARYRWRWVGCAPHSVSSIRLAPSRTAPGPPTTTRSRFRQANRRGSRWRSGRRASASGRVSGCGWSWSDDDLATFAHDDPNDRHSAIFDVFQRSAPSPVDLGGDQSGCGACRDHRR